jgi:hypothetical protein
VRNPLVGYLLTGVTIDARPGSVEVFGGTLSRRLYECVSFGRCSEMERIRSPVADAGRGSDPAFERGAIGPKNTRISTPQCRQYARLPQARFIYSVCASGSRRKRVWKCLDPP